LSFAEQAMDALIDADALIIVTEWKEFRSPDFERIKSLLRQPVVFDGRNMFVPALPEAAGIEYHAIGRLTAATALAIAGARAST
jgi:UDPglucose 6-dehydrogenase